MRTKFLLSFLFLSVVPLMISPVVGYIYSTTVLKEKLRTVAEQSMDSIEENINHVVNHIISASNVVVLDNSVQDILLTQTTSNASKVFNDRLMQTSLHYMEASVLLSYQVETTLLDFRGNLYQTNSEKMKVYNEVQEEAWYQEALSANGKFIWNTQLKGGQEGFTMARVIKKEAYIPTGVLSIHLLPDKKLLGLLERKNDFFGTMRFIVNNQGERILSTQMPEEEAEIENLIHMTDEIGLYTMNDEKVFVSKRVIDKTGWILIQIIPYDALMSDISSYRNFTLVTNIFFFVMILLVAYLLSQNITIAIKRLSQGMQRVTKGDLSVQLEVSGSLEVKQLNDSFNYMIDKIKILLDDVKEETKQKERIKLKALQAQINPHFLLNTLNGIKWLCVIEGAKTAEKMLISLGHLLENTLGKYDDFITLHHEIACLNSYIELQKMRYGNRFEVKFDIESKTLNTKVPVLLLQPIIENAILHAFDDMEDKGLIEVTTRMREDFVEIWITDNGKGMTEEQMKALLTPLSVEKKPTGIGILNVKERIELYYDEPCTLALDSEVGKGTRVLLLIKS